MHMTPIVCTPQAAGGIRWNSLGGTSNPSAHYAPCMSIHTWTPLGGGLLQPLVKIWVWETLSSWGSLKDSATLGEVVVLKAYAPRCNLGQYLV